jgi:hypothetical protein
VRKDLTAEPASWLIDPLIQSLVALVVSQHAKLDANNAKFTSRKHWTRASRDLRTRFYLCLHPLVLKANGVSARRSAWKSSIVF